jgi:protein SCO1/2
MGAFDTLRAIRIATWAAVAILGAAVLWLTVFNRSDDGGGIAAAAIGGPFSLVDQTGAPVTEAALKGHPSAMFFGYTFCPDVCPTTLADMTLWLQELGPVGDRLKVYFVTVDPERDTPDAMAEYLQAFDPRIVGLTGDRAAVDAMLAAFRVYARKTGEDGDYYLMDHTASVYLLDENAQFVGTVDYQEAPETALAKLKRLVGA